MQQHCSLTILFLLGLAPILSSNVTYAQVDHSKVVGVKACAECHADAHAVWEETKHATSWTSMHRSEEAQEIAKRLSIKGSIKRNARCLECHYTAQGDCKPKPISGVSCESCHGAAEGWLDVHSDFGCASADQESAEHCKARWQKCNELGMRHRKELYELVSQCYRCHTVPDEELINVGGHRDGGSFELVSWSQGEVRHNVFHSAGVNSEATAEHKRVLYVLGQLLTVEYNLRGLAQATEAGSYSKSMTRRVKKAMRKLKAIAKKGSLPEIDELVESLDALELSHEQGAALEQAADQVAGVAKTFGKERDGSKLASIDSLVPQQKAYKGSPAR